MTLQRTIRCMARVSYSWIISCCRIRVFGWKKGKPLAILNYHTATVNCVSFADSAVLQEHTNLLALAPMTKELAFGSCTNSGHEAPLPPPSPFHPCTFVQELAIGNTGSFNLQRHPYSLYYIHDVMKVCLEASFSNFEAAQICPFFWLRVDLFY